jgi:hypothetical protein
MRTYINPDAILDGSITKEKLATDIALGGKQLERVNYATLVDLRNNSLLSPGTWYRIIDYIPVSNDDVTSNASDTNTFDIIVLALSENELCEDCYAAHHDGDNMFVNDNLAAWQLKYTVDSNKYNWAPASNTIEIDSTYDSCAKDFTFTYDGEYNDNDCIYYKWTPNDNHFEYEVIGEDEYGTQVAHIGDRYILTDSVAPEYGQFVSLLTLTYAQAESIITPEYSKVKKHNIGGCGVVYRLQDDRGNDMPWDFYHIHDYYAYVQYPHLSEGNKVLVDTPCFSLEDFGVNLGKYTKNNTIINSKYVFMNHAHDNMIINSSWVHMLERPDYNSYFSIHESSGEYPTFDSNVVKYSTSVDIVPPVSVNYTYDFIPETQEYVSYVSHGEFVSAKNNVIDSSEMITICGSNNVINPGCYNVNFDSNVSKYIDDVYTPYFVSFDNCVVRHGTRDTYITTPNNLPEPNELPDNIRNDFSYRNLDIYCKYGIGGNAQNIYDETSENNSVYITPPTNTIDNNIPYIFSVDSENKGKWFNLADLIM